MNRRRDTRRKKVRNTFVSIVIGGIIVWFLLSKINPREIPRAIGNIPLWSLVIAFSLYATSVFFKAVRFKMILRTGISLRQLFPIVSLYMFFANTLPMRAGELSYVYLLKKQTRTPGAKSFASLIVGGIADVTVILAAMFIVGWRLKEALAEGISLFLSALGRRSKLMGSWAHELMGLSAYKLIIAIVFLVGGTIALVLLKRRLMQSIVSSQQSIVNSQQSLVDRGLATSDYRPKTGQHLASSIKEKILEVGRELADTPFDIRLLGIFACSISIIALRFGTQWYLVRSMGISIGIWQLSFALLFGVLFSLVPIHGPAGFGTVEAPWVAALVILSVPQKEAITSGFGLHIIIIMYCVVLGLFGFSILGFRFSISRIANRKSKIKNV